MPEDKLNGQLAFFPELETEPAMLPDEAQQAETVLSPDQMEQWLICILLGDILLRFDGVLPEDWLYEIAVTAGHLGYFAYMDAIGSLTEHGATVQQRDPDGKSCFVLTESGKRSVQRLRRYVPKLFRDRVHLTALRYVARQRALKEMQISYEPDGASGWQVCLSCTDSGSEMLYLRMHAPTKDQAELLGERILRNPAGFFGRLFDLALHNEEEQYDLTDN